MFMLRNNIYKKREKELRKYVIKTKKNKLSEFKF